MPTLDEQKTAAKLLIDQKAESVRLRYITGGAGQAAVYLEKAEQATDYVTAAYPADLTSYPFIQAEINATGKSKEDAADDILAQRSAWIAVGADIEEERLAGKIAVDQQMGEAGVQAARNAATNALDAL